MGKREMMEPLLLAMSSLEGVPVDGIFTSNVAVVLAIGSILVWASLFGYRSDEKLVHDIHAVLITVLGLMSVNESIPELVVIIVSGTYFAIDCLDSAYRQKYQMLLFHHGPTMALFTAQCYFPILLTRRFAGRLLLI